MTDSDKMMFNCQSRRSGILELVRKILAYESDAAQSLIGVSFRSQIIYQSVTVSSYANIFLYGFENRAHIDRENPMLDYLQIFLTFY